eukprot:TRINITY_DN1895_c0_g1_i1.p1 TRINITY_DN1895_c0_g1~~TRINITY_DN1895_c0_g1_i1.p1  ORF type:complete len:297 (-),score=34.97 TRINITY_DN1895_c0_g1_i1:172-1062(-)
MIFSSLIPSDRPNLLQLLRGSSNEKVNLGGSASSDDLTIEKKATPSSQPINISRTLSAPSSLKERARENEILEFSARSQFFCLFQHSMSNYRSAPSSLQSSSDTTFLKPLPTQSQKEVFNKYVVCYMNHWEVVYDLSFHVPPPRLEKQVISNFQCFVHSELTPLEWRLCSSFLKSVKPEFFDSLLSSVKEFKEFRQLLVKHYLGQQSSLKKLFSQDSAFQHDLQEDDLPLEITPATVFRYYLSTYYPNFIELWYPSDIILDSPLIQDIKNYHLRYPFPHSSILTYWLHPERTSEPE